MRAPILVTPSRVSNKPMPTLVEFNERSKALLAQVNPALAKLMYQTEARLPDAFEITEGMRSSDRQAQLVAQGASQTMNSRHIAGNAVDIVIPGGNGQPNWNFEDYRPIADTAKAVAAEQGVSDFVWGGDWKTLKDGVHFQVGGPSVPGTSAPPAQPALSFGSAIPAAPTDMAGIAGMFGGGGLAMGVDPFAVSAQLQTRQREDRKRDEEDAAQIKRQALLSGVGAMFG